MAFAKSLEPLLHEGEAAKILNVSIARLQRWRWEEAGPRYIRVSGKPTGAVRYRLSDLEEYLTANTVEPRVGANVS